MRWGQWVEQMTQKRKVERHLSTGSELDRKFRVGLVLYAVLAALAWFTLGEEKVLLGNRLVELRLLPLIVIGGMVLKSVLARQADRIRRDREEGR
jgi:hypothetical protein